MSVAILVALLFADLRVLVSVVLAVAVLKALTPSRKEPAEPISQRVNSTAPVLTLRSTPTLRIVHRGGQR